MIITADMLTEKYGFKKDVPVEVILSKKVADWLEVDVPYLLRFVEVYGQKNIPVLVLRGIKKINLFSVFLTDIVRIRPLQGDLAVWNFVPDWAHCCEKRAFENKCYLWMSEEETTSSIELGMKAVLRPWWA